MRTAGFWIRNDNNLGLPGRKYMTRFPTLSLHRAVLVTLLMASALLTSTLLPWTLAGAHADEKFPSHPITLIVPTPPGGGTDVAARLLSSLAETALGQKIIVVDKPGAGGVIGVEEMLRAAPDGYTIAGVWNSPLTITPQLYPVSYKQDAYLPVVLSDTSPITFCVMKDFPAQDGRALIALLRDNPNKYTYGTDGVSGTVHLAAELMFATLGVKARAIPYGGAGETLTAFMGHSVDIYGGSLPPILPFVQNGTARCLMLSSANANSMLPGTASLQDLGIPQDQTWLWHAVIAPAGIPKDRLAILEHAFQDAASSSKYQEFAKKQGEEAVAWKSAEARAFIDKEYAALSGVIARLGLAQGSHPSSGTGTAFGEAMNRARDDEDGANAPEHSITFWHECRVSPRLSGRGIRRMLSVKRLRAIRASRSRSSVVIASAAASRRQSDCEPRTPSQ